MPSLLAFLFLVSCAAPVSLVEIKSKIPPGDYNNYPLSDAFRELEAGKAAHDPMVASGHFIESARLAGEKALAGEQGAVALYNHAVGRLVETLDKADSLPWGRTIQVGSYQLSGKLEPKAPKRVRTYVPVDSVDFHGRYSENQAIRKGLGAALVAVSEEDHDFRKTYDTPRVHAALTAILRSGGGSRATLELHDPLDEERVSIAGRSPVLAANFTAPAAMFMAVARPDKLGLVRLLQPEKYADTARLSRLQRYDPERIPVLFVHGLQDTPATWAPMFNSLMQDPLLRARYQFWVFSYPSGYPYPYSASLLRKELDGVNRAFPHHKDIVIIGHSMGGIISRLMVTDADEKIWISIFGKRPQQMPIKGASRQLLLDSLVFDHRKEIKRAIFIAAPHRGSLFANNWISRLGSRLVRMPGLLTDARNAVASVLTADRASLKLDRTPNSIDTLSPNNSFVKAVNKIPIAPGVTYHSIMGDRGKGDTPNSTDGFVPYWSSHLDGAASEKIVPSHHSAHQNPEGIAEVRRILRLNIGVK